MKDIKWSAVLVSFAASFFGGFTLSSIVGVLAVVLFRTPGESATDFEQRLAVSIPYNTLVLVTGCASDVLLGFIAARMAPQAPKPNAIAGGALVCLACLPLVPWLATLEPPFFLVASFVVVIPCALLGVALSRRLP